MSSSLTETDSFSGHYGKYEGRNYKASKKLKRVAKRITECPKCGSKNLEQDYEKAEIYCADCGFVITENIIDTGPEWRAFNPEQWEGKTRVGPPMTHRIHDKGLGTLPPREIVRTRGLRSGLNSDDQIIISVIFEIERMSSILRLPLNIREAAVLLYKRVRREHLLQGRDTKETVPAILYIICRQWEVPRTLNEISNAAGSGTKKAKISKRSNFFSRELNLKLSILSPLLFVNRFCSMLDLNNDVRKKAKEIIKKSEEAGITNGKDPTGIAAGAIYLAAILGAQHRTEREISEISGITSATIRTRCKEMEELGLSIFLEEHSEN